MPKTATIVGAVYVSKLPRKTSSSATKPDSVGRPSEAKPAITITVAASGIVCARPDELVDVTRVRAVVDEADHDEEQARDRAVREHLQRGPFRLTWPSAAMPSST